MDKHKRRALARLAAYALSRRPDEFGLVPDEAGFIPLKTLVRALAEEEGWAFLREPHLREVVREPRHAADFELDSEERIRSAAPDALAGFFRPAPEPPPILYHAARRKAYPHILEHGLSAPEGAWVVLAASAEMALKVGRRRDGEPVMLEVRAAQAAEAGVEFHQAGELLYVAAAVPRQNLCGPPLERVPMPRRRPQAEAPAGEPAPTPGSFLVRPELLPGASKRERERGKRAEPEWKRERRRGRRRRDEDE